MIVYDKKGNKININIDNLTRIGYGCFGKVYRDGDKAIKIINDNAIFRPNEQSLKLIKDQKLKGFYRIKELFYNKQGDLNGYSMKYYEPFYTDLFFNKEYLLDSLRDIYESIKLLSKEQIRCIDLQGCNIIKTKNGLRVIDCDFYEKSNSSRILENNLMMLLEAIAELLANDFSNDQDQARLYKDVILRNIITTPSYQESLEKMLLELNHCDRPHKYFLR